MDRAHRCENEMREIMRKYGHHVEDVRTGAQYRYCVESTS